MQNLGSEDNGHLTVMGRLEEIFVTEEFYVKKKKSVEKQLVARPKSLQQNSVGTRSQRGLSALGRGRYHLF